MATIGDPNTAPIKLRCCRGRRRFIILIALLLLLGFGSFKFFKHHHRGHRHFHEHEHGRLVQQTLEETAKLQSTIQSMAREIEMLKRQVTDNTQQIPKMDHKEFSAEFREVIMQEVNAVKNAQRDMQRRHDLMREQYQYEIDALNVEVLILKKELNLLKQNSGKTSSEEKPDEEVSEDWMDKTQKMANEGFYRMKTFMKEDVSRAANDVKDSAKRSYENVKDYVGDNAPQFAKKVEVTAKETMEKVKNFGQDVGEAAKKGFNNAREFVNEKAPEMGKKATESFGKAKEFVKKAPEAAKKVKETVEQGFEKVKDFVGKNGPKVTEKMRDTARETLKNLKEKTDKTREAIADQAKKVGEALFNWMNRKIEEECPECEL